jgi:chemotaxis protein MotB
MKKILSTQTISAFAIGLMLFGCVPARKFEETKTKYTRCEEELTSSKASNKDLQTKNTELLAQIRESEKKLNVLQNDTALLNSSLSQLKSNYDKISETYDLLLEKNKDLLSGNAVEVQKLSTQLQATMEDLHKKEDALKILERELLAKKLNLENLQIELQAREEKVNELQNILKQKDAAVNELKKKVQAALLGFENNGLTITQKNGKVYVSLDEQLLFASGSIKVEEKGIEALKKLAKVLEQNKDINVLIEGHTDDVAMSGSGPIKDNWDLSALRATSIVKIITLNSKTEPTRLTSAGRGEFMPIDDSKTPEARKKNRRTEIILTPKLDELLQILETN